MLANGSTLIAAEAGLGRLLALRDVQLYLAGAALSLFGDTTLYLAAAVWVKTLTGSNGAAGLIFFLLGVPSLCAPTGRQTWFNEVGRWNQASPIRLPSRISASPITSIQSAVLIPNLPEHSERARFGRPRRTTVQGVFRRIREPQSPILQVHGDRRPQPRRGPDEAGVDQPGHARQARRGYRAVGGQGNHRGDP